MNVTFDVSLWTLLFNFVTLCLALYGVVYARARASTEEINGIRYNFTHALEDHKEKTGATFTRMGERLYGLETEARKAITHDDLSKLYDKINQVERSMSNMNGDVRQCIGKLDSKLDAATNGMYMLQQFLMDQKNVRT